jgi:hypothetical protein
VKCILCFFIQLSIHRAFKPFTKKLFTNLFHFYTLKTQGVFMKGKTLGLVAGGIGLAWWLSSKAFNMKEAIGKLSATNPKIKIALKGLNILLDVTVSIVNPASVDIPFEYYAGSIFYANGKIAAFNYNGDGKAVSLKARSATPLNFTVNISTANVVLKLVQLIRALSSTKKFDTSVGVQSAIYAAGFDVPVNFVYDLKTQTQISGIGRAKFFKRFSRLVNPLAVPMQLAKKLKGKRAANLLNPFAVLMAPGRKLKQRRAMRMAPVEQPAYIAPVVEQPAYVAPVEQSFPVVQVDQTQPTEVIKNSVEPAAVSWVEYGD